MDKFIPYKKWLHQHDEEIKTDFPDCPTDALAQKIDVNYYIASRRATRLGVGKSAAFMHASWKKGGCRKGGWKKRNNHAKNSEAADRYMREHFANTKNEELAAHFDVDVKTIRRWARRLDLTKTQDFMKRARTSANHSYYTPEQEAYRIRRIAEVFPDADDEAMQQLAEELGVSLGTLRILAIKNGVRRSKATITKAQKKGQLFRTKFTPEIIAALREYYPDHTNEECAEHFGVNLGSLKVVASKHGMKKSREHRSHVSRMNRM